MNTELNKLMNEYANQENSVEETEYTVYGKTLGETTQGECCCASLGALCCCGI